MNLLPGSRGAGGINVLGELYIETSRTGLPFTWWTLRDEAGNPIQYGDIHGAFAPVRSGRVMGSPTPWFGSMQIYGPHSFALTVKPAASTHYSVQHLRVPKLLRALLFTRVYVGADLPAGATTTPPVVRTAGRRTGRTPDGLEQFPEDVPAAAGVPRYVVTYGTLSVRANGNLIWRNDGLNVNSPPSMASDGKHRYKPGRVFASGTSLFLHHETARDFSGSHFGTVLIVEESS